MNLEAIKTVSKLKAARGVLQLKKHSPTALMAAGLVGMLTSTVLAAKQTLKLEGIMDIHDERVAEIVAFQAKVEDGEVELENDMKAEDFKKVIILQHVKTGASIAKLYWLPASIGAVSVAAIIGGHVQLTKRNAALAATATSLQVAFNRYRQKVVEEFGADKESEIRRSMHVQKETDPKTGEELGSFRVDDVSLYAAWFDEKNHNFKGHEQSDRVFLRTQQNYLNDRLKAYGHVFLNELYDALGMERTREGSVVGWVDGEGQDYIDFGIDWSLPEDATVQRGDMKNIENHLDIEQGVVVGYLVDPNVWGVIWNKI